jgi:ribosomal protein S18 acetylase RimI-like enzyme
MITRYATSEDFEQIGRFDKCGQYRPADLQRLASDRRSFVRVSVAGDRAVGFIAFTYMPRKTIVIHRIAINQFFKRRFIGLRFVSKLKESHQRRIVAMVNCDNWEALAFFKKCGLVVVSKSFVPGIGQEYFKVAWHRNRTDVQAAVNRMETD